MTKYPNLTLDHQLCFALYAATNAITRSYRNQLGELGLTYPQYLVMLVLWERDGLSVKEIARRLQLDSPAVTPLLKRLEAAGWIRRSRSAADERSVHVYLTEAGDGIQAAVARKQKAVACQTELSDCEFEELRNSLHRLADRLARHLQEAV